MDLDGLNSSWWPYVVALFVGIVSVIRSYIGGNRCPCDDNVNEKIIVVTGSSSGLGLEIAKELSKRGGKIILTYRNIEKGNAALQTIKQRNPNAEIRLHYLDTSSMKSVREFAEAMSLYERIDILVNNAGIMLHPFQLTPEGFETHFATNYLGHFLLAHLLMPQLEKSCNGRIINVSAQAYSSGHINFNDINLRNAGGNNTIKAFTQSKLSLVLMTRYMSKILKEGGRKVTINTVDPGLVRNTGHMKNSPLKTSIPVQLSVWPWMWLFLKTPTQGIQSIVYLAVDPKLDSVSGQYFSNCEIRELAENCSDVSVDERLYEMSCTLVNIPGLRM